MRIKVFGLCLCTIIVIAGCAKKPTLLRERLTTNTQQPHSTPPQAKASDIITIWVHGTVTITGTIMPNYFYRPDGMAAATTLDSKYHLREIADALAQANPVEYALDHIYFFGWSGALDFKARKKAAHDLNEAIKKLIITYKKTHGIAPRIRIITHSHGGNVALNLATIKDQDAFSIDELILLACPVQEKTEQHIKSSRFKEIFALYSAIDLLQVVDPQGLYRHKHKSHNLFSQRRFPDQENLTQVKMKLNGRAPLHVDFIRSQFVAVLPHIIDKLKTWREKTANGKLSESDAHRILSLKIK